MRYPGGQPSISNPVIDFERVKSVSQVDQELFSERVFMFSFDKNYPNLIPRKDMTEKDFWKLILGGKLNSFDIQKIIDLSMGDELISINNNLYLYGPTVVVNSLFLKLRNSNEAKDLFNKHIGEKLLFVNVDESWSGFGAVPKQRV